MSESVEVRVARLEENLRFLVDEAKEARINRKGQYDSIEALKASLAAMAGEVTKVRTKLDGQTPTIEEFITIKHKVVGAGNLGKWLWTAGAFIIGIVFSSREQIISWLSK